MTTRCLSYLHGLTLVALLLPLVALFAPPPQAAQAFTQNPATVWINEFHYDNSGSDTGEFIEIAGPAGTNLTGWSIVLYNGSSSVRAPYDTESLSGTLGDDTGTGFGFQDIAIAGIQNGAPDGFALVDDSGTVVQFLSYEGSFTAASGVAAGLPSTNIGVSEGSGTPVGHSLQLSGTGSTYQDFTWQAPAADTPGAANNGQTFTGGGPSDTAPAVSSSTPANNGTVLPNANLSVTFSEAVTVTGDWASVACGTSGTQSVGGGTLTVTDSDPTFTLNPTTDFTVGESCTLTIFAAQVADDDGDDPPDTLAADVTIDFTVNGPQVFPLTEDFTSCALTDWAIVSVDTDTANTWSCGSGYVEANGFSDAAPADEWLITPPFDMDAQTGEVLSFRTWTRFSDSVYPPLEVVYSTDYDGGGDPTTATWTQLTGITFSPQNSQVWTPSGSISLASISGSSVSFAFHYTSTGTGNGTAAQWRVDDVAFTTVAEAAPAVSSSTPANNGTVLPNANLSVTFSEAVTVTGDWASVTCGTSGTQSVGGGTLTVTDSDPTFTLNPATNFTVGESCTLTIFAAQVADDDGDDPPDTLAADVTIDFTVAAACTASDTLISAVQGNGNAGNGTAGSTTYTVEGVVTGVYPDLAGFYMQEEDADADGDPATSEGIFIFLDGTPTVSEGDVVQVSGTFDEFFDETQLDNVTNTETCSTGNPLPTPIDVTLPVPADVGGVPFLERYEGMLVNFPQDLIVSETFNLGRGGLLRLSANNRLYQPTQLATPGAASDALAETNALNQIVLDDGTTAQNPDPVIYPTGGLSASNTVRGGDTVAGVAGVLAYRWHGYNLSGNSTNAYRVYPTSTTNVSFTATNPRQATPDPVGGTLKVASFNVLNYFTTTGSGNNCGPSGNLGCRGADNAAEFARQHDKIVAALNAMDADIVGLIELENSNNNTPLNVLVNGGTVGGVTVTGLDALSARDYEFVATGAIGTDAIRQGFIYDANTVSLPSLFAVLDTTAFVDPNNIGPKNRPALAQTFTETATGGEVTVVVNHLKSKGSSCGASDDDPRQGNCNDTRDKAAQALAAWLAGNPTGAATNNIMIIGDLNAYAQEDPLLSLQAAGYTDLATTFVGARAYSFVFDGESGTLDYALANGDLLPKVTGVTEWHINTDEPRALDYDLDFKSTGQQTSFYNADAFRSSDHDPVIVGLSLGTTIVVDGTADDSTVTALNGNGTCDLREAIVASNTDAVVGECAAGSNTGTDYITFDIAGSGPHAINLQAVLNVDGTNALVIDGVSEPDASCTNGVPNPSVQLQNTSNLLNIASASHNVTVRGLAFNNFSSRGLQAEPSSAFAGATLTVECNTFTSSSGAPVSIIIDNLSGVVRGNAFTAPGNGVSLSGDDAGAVYDVYANNFNSYGGDAGASVAILVGSNNGTERIRYNYYGTCTDTTDCFGGSGLTAPVRSDAWQYRLGAPVQGWSMGAGGTSLDTPDGPALLETVGGDGTAVIINHGVGTNDANVPFSAFGPTFGNDRCTNYYDFFVMDSGGADGDNWNIEVPLYTSGGCASVNSLSLFDLNRDAPNHAALCPGGGFWCYWNPVAGVLNSQNPNPALQATLPETSLLGTPLVGGNATNQDPTSVSLVGFAATPGSNQLVALLPVLAGLLLLAGTVLLVTRRRRG